MSDSRIELSNGVKMPNLIQGIPLLRDYANRSSKSFLDIIKLSLDCGIRAFDTSHDYGKSEAFLGKSIKWLTQKTQYKREDIFIVTKIGNGQQLSGRVEDAVNASLKTLGVDEIDLMLLHWPVPDVYVENYRILERIYKTGKVRAIGIANVLERHLKTMKQNGFVPHVAQFEYHPFRTVPSLMDYCKNENITVQAYTSLLQMIPKITENETLIRLSEKYKKTIPQIVLRWHIQQGIAPVFRTYNPKHLKESVGVFDFSLSDEDMNCISSLNENFKFHPESMNCPGF
ncbi:MAG: aldo/keto reductase [Fibrobacter sp.]|nr:aldo/keto reductase [Fibrobacter sp.]